MDLRLKKPRNFCVHFSGTPRLTLFGRSLLLIFLEILINAICWIVAGILFGIRDRSQSILSLALLAWTIGLRHALDADHISAIDNATRGLISLGQLPVTCGLWFSLGHSTIVIVVNVAIAISTDIYDKIKGVGNVGAVVGAAVSGSFLFIIGSANSIILWRIIRKRRLEKQRNAQRLADGENDSSHIAYQSNYGTHNNMLIMRLLGPIIHFVDRPWKMYPVGVLFGFGFDTASSIALLAISAIAKKGSDGKQIPPGDIIILPLLFTAGMTLVDSIDSILMLYSYSGFPEFTWAIFEHAQSVQTCATEDGTAGSLPSIHSTPSIQEIARTDECPINTSKATIGSKLNSNTEMNMTETKAARDLQVTRNTMSGLSIMLTLMSILVAFSISIITIMGLIGDNCRPCQVAASAEDGHGGGLAGSWWRFWSKANDNSGFIGVGIVGAFVLVVCGWYGSIWLGKKIRRQRT